MTLLERASPLERDEWLEPFVVDRLTKGIHLEEDLTLPAAEGIGASGDKHPLGLIEGATENAVVVQALLDNLVERGLDPTVGRLFIIDGAKALTKAIRKTPVASSATPPASAYNLMTAWCWSAAVCPGGEVCPMIGKKDEMPWRNRCFTVLGANYVRRGRPGRQLNVTQSAHFNERCAWLSEAGEPLETLGRSKMSD